MQADIPRLKDALKAHALNPSEESRQIVLSIIMNFCKNKELIRTLSIKSQLQMSCSICHKYVNPDLRETFYMVGCKCCTTWHKKCLQEEGVRVTEGFLERSNELEKIRCSKCNEKVPARHFRTNIFGEQEFKKKIEEATTKFVATEEEKMKSLPKIVPEENKIKEVKCSLCEKIITAENIKKEVKTLDCDHKFCGNCLKNDFDKQLDANPLNILCPLQNCGKKVSPEIIDNNSDPMKYFQYSVFLADQDKIQCSGECGKNYLRAEIPPPLMVCQDCLNRQNIVNNP